MALQAMHHITVSPLPSSHVGLIGADTRSLVIFREQIIRQADWVPDIEACWVSAQGCWHHSTEWHTHMGR